MADFFEARLVDSLAAIQPGVFNSWTAITSHPGISGQNIQVENLIVPEDTLIVYVGGRDLGGSLAVAGPGGYSANGFPSFLNTLSARGQAGALNSTSEISDFAPWGGVIIFNTSYSWNFQTAVSGEGSAFDFVATALHEFCHVLGVGTAESWDNQINQDNFFTGPLSVASFGGPVPVESNWGHWQNDGSCQSPLGYDPDNPLNVLSRTYGSFGSTHGMNQIAIMDPQICAYFSDFIHVLTDLDLAALSDIGWDVRLPLNMEVQLLGPGVSSFLWPSSSGISVSLQRSTDLTGPWSDIATTMIGDGSLKQMTDSSAPSGNAFYRLLEGSSGTAAPLRPESLRYSAASQNEATESVLQASRAPVLVESCGHCMEACCGHEE